MENKKREAPLFAWPREDLDNFKYLLYGPLVGKVLYAIYKQEISKNDRWYLHIIILFGLRALVYQLWSTYSNMFFLNRAHRVNPQGVGFNQIDAEWHWDTFLILEATLASLSYLSFPFLGNLRMWDMRGTLCCLILHIGISEPLYYWTHRLLHLPGLFHKYHWRHHSSKVPNPFTAGHGSFLEHLLLCLVIGIPTLGTVFMGYGSITVMYSYTLVFDFLRCLGHSNIEVITFRLFEAFPLLKYLIYTPTYHSLHHMDMGTNFCLFMPLYDKLWNTLNTNSWDLHKEISSRTNSRVPDFVFLGHGVDIMSAMHAPFLFGSFSSKPFIIKPFLFPLLPYVFIIMLVMWVKSKTFLFSSYYLRGKLHQTWVVPRFGFQYFLTFAAQGINDQIEDAILKADKIGIMVISLAALNKNEGLNGGGMHFIEKHPNQRVRVVHGNTLTAAVILNEIPKDVDEVFLTGATSKLGRAIALYLVRRKVKVLMLTLSKERFLKIQKEASPDCQEYLVQVTKYQAAKRCKLWTWIMGKWATVREQYCAPSGTYFHQFVVPPIIQFRKDCTYGKLAAMKLPDDVEGLGSCEYTMGRGVVHACHAGGIVHLLEGWKHHEVGAINVDQIDVVWKAALRHGFKPL